MDTTYDVNVWSIRENVGTTAKTYSVRWKVGSRRWKTTFKTAALADSFRSDLLSAARKGEAFDTTTGRPISMLRASKDMYAFACTYVDLKWPRVAATTRHTHAEALTAVTTVMFTSTRGQPDGRASPRRPEALGVQHRPPRRPQLPRQRSQHPALGHQPHATRVRAARSENAAAGPRRPHGQARRHPGGTERDQPATQDPPRCPGVRRRAGAARQEPDASAEVDAAQDHSRSRPAPVANPIAARTLLHAVGQQRGGRRLVAFFGCLYYAALRPEEASSLTMHNLSLPARGWGELHVERAEPYAGKEWTDSGRNRDQRPLKQRARGEVRVVPCPPALTELLHAHIAEFGVQPDGRLFVGERNGGELPTMTIGRMWRRARQAAFMPEVAASPLARTPYDLRHAAVSTWLNGGVPATTVAEWAGHSVEILLRIYAKCLDGSDALIRQRVQAVLGYADTE
jgi:integrase